MAFHVLQRPFLATRCGQRSSSLPLSFLSWKQHRKVFPAVSIRNSIINCNTSYPYLFGEESPYEKELLIVERRRDELESLPNMYDELPFGRSVIGNEHRWLNTLERIIRFYYKKGRLPKREAEEEEGRLARWLNTQRRAKYCQDEGKPCNNKMTPERIGILESMSWWIWDAYEAAWQEKFEELVDSVNETGEIPPQSHPTLGYWVNNQRVAHRAWKGHRSGGAEKYKSVTNCMDEERAKKLETVPGWKWEMCC